MRSWFLALGPVRVAFIGSTLLSLVAISKGTINRDGMLYVDAARMFLAVGFEATMSVFTWPFLPMLMATVSGISGLGLETSGYLLSTLFMAGTCALLVASARQRFPEAAWYACLTILALPGFNVYRDELLREYGCWFFVMLSLWLALRWTDRPDWPRALAIQGALGVAALFRPEALALFGALVLWQWAESPEGERWQRITMIGSLPVLAVPVLLALIASGQFQFGRLAADFQRLGLHQFDARVQALADVLFEYSRSQAATILFFGSLAIIPVKFLVKLGVFVIPFFRVFIGESLGALLGRCGIFAWMFLAHLLVLVVFVLEMQFLAGRYVGPLLLFSAPLIGVGMLRLVQALPRLRWLVLLLAVLTMFANVVSLSPGKQHYVAAGQWLAGNAAESPRVYVDSARTAYYAGWRFSGRPASEQRTDLAAALAQGKYDLLVLEISRKETGFTEWLAANSLEIVQTFKHHDGDSVVVARPLPE